MANKAGLYNWERFSKQRIYSRNQRVTSDHDIQDWLKTVEQASSKAAAETFGTTSYVPPRRQAKQSLNRAIEDAQIHDAAYSEAQDLLNQWVTDKIHLDNDDDSEEVWSKKTEADIRQEWDHLLTSDADLELDELNLQLADSSKSVEAKKKRDSDPYSVLYKDDGDLVNEVLDEMWHKQIFKDSFKENLELDSQKQRDPTTKMKLRHLQVKENRQKRIKEKERKLRDLQSKKEAQFHARQILLKEERTKNLLKKQEEFEIQKEMAHIRKEMEYERKKQREEHARKVAEEEAMEEKLTEERRRQDREETEVKYRIHQQAEERKKLILSKIQQIETRRAKDNLKISQKYFSAWYNVVIEKRLAMGKVKAMADWKLLLRVFNSWKAYTRAKNMDKEAWVHEENLKQLHRKKNMADNYYRHRLLSWCLTAWQLFVSQQQKERYNEECNKKTRDKMAAFLEAAASGKLWSDRSSPQEKSVSSSPNVSPNAQVDDMFNEPQKVKGSFSMSSTCRSELGTDTTPKKKVATPKQPWQITRKHLKLTKKQISSMGAKDKKCGCGASPAGQADSSTCSHCSNQTSKNGSFEENRDRESPKNAWEKSPFTVNNFEHRHAAQQKILQMQQKQIKEQQKLIEELQYLQKQQLLQQQLLQQEQAKVQLGLGTGNGASSIQNTLTHLQTHIHSLQQQILENGVSGRDSPFPGGTRATHLDSGDIQVKDLEGDVVEGRGELTLNLDKVMTKGEGEMTSRSVMSGSSTVTGKTPSSNTARTTSTMHHPRHIDFLKTMEQRAAERTRIKQDRERKKQQEEEVRLARLLEQEERRKQEEAEAKKKRIEEHREKKRLQKQQEVEKQKFGERLKMLSEKADTHKDMSLVKFRGWLPWRRLIENLRDRERMADSHCQLTVLRKCMLRWRDTVKTEIQLKCDTAQQFNVYITIKHAFHQWKMVKHTAVIQEEKAARHHEFKVKLKAIRLWADFAAEEKVSMWHKERRSKEHNLQRIKKKYLIMLQQFPAKQKEAEEREKRREELRKKVSYFLPDFRASQND